MTAYADMSEVQRLAQNLNMSVALVEGLAESAVAHAAEEVAEAARRMAPVGETGRLRTSIREHRNQTGAPGAADWAITASAPYSAYVEFGTRRQAPQPFMIPAADLAGPLLEQTLLQFVRPLGR